MEAIFILLKQLFILAIIIGIGAAGGKLKVIRETETDALQRIIFYITLPLLILTSIWGLETTPELLRNSMYTILLSYVSLLMLFILGRVTYGFNRLTSHTRPIYMFHILFGNAVFIGFPLIRSFFSNEGIFYATIYIIVANSVLWTYGISIMRKTESPGFWEKLKALINPHTVAFLIGMILMLVKISYPPVIKKSLGAVGDATIYLSMLYLGAILSQIRLGGLIRRMEVISVSVIRLLVGPVLLILFIEGMATIFPIELGNVAKMVLILETGMPCMITGVVLARSFGRDDHLASANVFVTSLLSLLTLPLIYYLAEIISF